MKTGKATIVTVQLLIAETGEGECADAVSGILTEQMRHYAGEHSSLLDWRYALNGAGNYQTDGEQVDVELVPGNFAGGIIIDADHFYYDPDKSASPWPNAIKKAKP